MSRNAPGSALPGEITDAFSVKRRTRSHGRREQCTIEHHARRNRKLRRRVPPSTQLDVRASGPIFKRNIADRDGAEGGCVNGIANEIERASRHTAPARLLTRMAAIENRDAHSRAGETPR